MKSQIYAEPSFNSLFGSVKVAFYEPNRLAEGGGYLKPVGWSDTIIIISAPSPASPVLSETSLFRMASFIPTKMSHDSAMSNGNEGECFLLHFDTLITGHSV